VRCLPLFWLLFVLSAALTASPQEISSRSSSLIKAFRKADNYYQKTHRTKSSKTLTELQESKYNMAALKQFIYADSLLSANTYHNDSLRFIISTKTAELAHYFDSLTLAIYYYSLAITLKQHLPQLQDSLLFKLYLFSGQIYFSQNKLDSALGYFKKAELIQHKYTTALLAGERLNNSFGVLYFQEGNYRQAANYFRKATEMLNKKDKYFIDFFVNYNINYATTLFKLENYDSAYSILKSLLPYNIHLNEIINNIGLIEAGKGNFRNALKQFHKVRYYNKLDIGLANDIATSWFGIRQYDSAENYLTLALNENKKYNGIHSGVDHGLTYKISGDLKAALNSYNDALLYYQKALVQFYPSFKDSSILSNPQKFSGVFSYINLFHTLLAKAGAFHALYFKSGNISWAKEELQTFITSLNLLDYIEKVYESDEARLFLEKSRYLIHDKPIEIAFGLYRETHDIVFLEQAYTIDQRTKATLLAFNDRRNQVIQPASKILREELSLKKTITRLSLSAQTLTDVVQIETINRQIHDLEIRLSKVQEAIAREYPSAGISIPSVKTLQQQLLDPATMIVSYHLAKDKLTTFIVTKSNFKASQQIIYPAFRNDINSLVSRLHNHTDSVSSIPYEQKISAVLLQDIDEKNYPSLIIIPDDELNYLPFECLKKKDKYLIELVSVQYQYSTSLLKKELTDFKKSSSVSFAPFSDQLYKDSLYSFARLYYSSNEATDLTGVTFLNRQATKQRFLTSLSGGDIIHLATHAVATDSSENSSYVVFAPWGQSRSADYLLYNQEIYNLNMRNNKLIILSACETGYGKLIKGEGVMSLSRAFAYAGCPDIITSLWKADDEATAFITGQIHLNLSKGHSIARSVQEAKKAYLADGKVNPRRKDPAYWANLIFIGNYKAATGNFIWAWLVPSMLAFVYLLYRVIKYIKLGNQVL